MTTTDSWQDMFLQATQAEFNILKYGCSFSLVIYSIGLLVVLLSKDRHKFWFVVVPLVFSCIALSIATALIWKFADIETIDDAVKDDIKYYVTFCSVLHIDYSYAYFLLQAASQFILFSHWIVVY